MQETDLSSRGSGLFLSPCSKALSSKLRGCELYRCGRG